jgi:hypothetical protein
MRTEKEKKKEDVFRTIQEDILDLRNLTCNHRFYVR